uniref:nucleolar protein dao-5 n=1 Tax=Anopheles coluzzii TaxID=1518534 RepID=UPI0020FF9F8C|nr:nucleolar protein dao-5 [Anopheles coluzzii]
MGKTAAISTVDEQEIAEARGTTVPDMLYDVVARVATTSIGQFVYKRVDNLLWTMEKTARWSLPQPSPVGGAKKSSPEADEDIGSNISGPPLIRPLPWLLFLPALIVLRMVRSTLSLGARFIGRGPVLPSSMVGFLQNKRRKLRALKYRGQRLQRIAKVEQEADPKQVTWLQRIILPLRMVICTRPYRTIDTNSDVAHAVIFRKDRPASFAGQKRVESKKRNLNQREAESEEEDCSDEYSFEDAGCKELLDKYANEEDSSFNVENASSSSSDCSLSDADPSPKKPTLETSLEQKEQSQPKQNGAHQPPAKPDTLKRSASENKNGVDSQSSAPKTSSAAKTINAANRSKSAADLENGSNTQSSNGTTGPDGKNGSAPNTTTTPSKSIPNLSSSPENNENKPINQNGPGGPAASLASAASQIKSPSPTVLKSSTAKQSPNMGEVRNNFQQQKQPSQKQLATSGSAANQQPSQQAGQQQQQQQYVSNGAKSRNKKGPTQSIA